MKLTRILLIFALLLPAATPWAAAPVERTSAQGIRYVSGGVGDAEMAAMREVATRYNVEILMATDRGRYLSGTQVRIVDKDAREVLAVIAEGPLLLVQLPPGVYTVQATASSKRIDKPVSVTAGQRHKLDFRWPGMGD